MGHCLDVIVVGLGVNLQMADSGSFCQVETGWSGRTVELEGAGRMWLNVWGRYRAIELR